MFEPERLNIGYISFHTQKMEIKKNATVAFIEAKKTMRAVENSLDKCLLLALLTRNYQ
mgnify:CR=1 FL=1